MTIIEEKVQEICSRLWDKGFIQQYKNGNVDQATQAILALIKPMSREQIKETINLVFADYALNGQGGRNLTADLADAILAEWGKE